MRHSVLLSLAALFYRVRSSNPPRFQFDSATTKDCIEWVDIADNTTETCESTLRYWGINPTQFHAWNPSVGLDCQPWYDYTSYCIVTLERLDSTVHTTNEEGYTIAVMTTDKDGWRIPITASSGSATTTSPSKTTAATTTSTSSLAPSPTVWTEIGCYAENPSHPILEHLMSPNGGDAALSIAKCKETCYRASYEFAGVQAGDQCWCSSYVGGEWAKNQSDCSLPCSGDATTNCGGKEKLRVFEARENMSMSGTGSGTATSALVASTGSAVSSLGPQTTGVSSGARRNVKMLWRM